MGPSHVSSSTAHGSENTCLLPGVTMEMSLTFLSIPTPVISLMMSSTCVYVCGCVYCVHCVHCVHVGVCIVCIVYTWACVCGCTWVSGRVRRALEAAYIQLDNIADKTSQTCHPPQQLKMSHWIHCWQNDGMWVLKCVKSTHVTMRTSERTYPLNKDPHVCTCRSTSFMREREYLSALNTSRSCSGSSFFASGMVSINNVHSSRTVLLISALAAASVPFRTQTWVKREQ